ncbi:sugar transferase [Aminipila luticellarii]|uniref:Sugar transferase n=1 Tax=Aminipila luticellarii TaxID=2507160 RepID=A0A410PSD5_9FIRM|nr:sugar transferase [Aminipila luticellarii]QAT41901.1 sugar transferase [Aminipila luticellarii]
MKSVAKRILDICCSLVLLIILSPVFFLLFLLCKLKLGSPAIFKQARPGIHGKVFTMYKFRSMTEERDEAGQLLSDEIRLTSFGKLLRKTSLDELPELFNILKGDMSFVGPRPLLVRYLDRYTEEQARRHEVKPGLTGWAQVNGRNAINWEEKFKLDVWYVDHWNLWLDLKIFVLTFLKVFKHEGINSTGEATMQEFMGTKK